MLMTLCFSLHLLLLYVKRLLCDDYAQEYHIVFNAKTSKCLVLLPSTRRFSWDLLHPYTFYIGGVPMELVDSFWHLGYLITCEFSDSSDLLKRRCDFIQVTCCVY